MFESLKRRLSDVRTLTRLCTVAEAIAHQHGQSKPGSEHFILAALALPDQTAAQAFAHLGISAQRFQEALAAQRSDALASVGIVAETGGVTQLPSFPPPASVLYETEPSGQALVKHLADTRKARAGRLLLGADVLLAAALERYTPSGRAFQKLGVSTVQLTEAAEKSIRRADASMPVRVQ